MLPGPHEAGRHPERLLDSVLLINEREPRASPYPVTHRVDMETTERAPLAEVLGELVLNQVLSRDASADCCLESRCVRMEAELMEFAESSLGWLEGRRAVLKPLAEGMVSGLCPNSTKDRLEKHF